MFVINITRKTLISRDCKIAKTLTDKLFGLIKKSSSGSILLKTRFGIHTFFVKTPIDVLVLDEKKIVRKTATVLPNCFFLYNPKYLNVLELPKGAINQSKTIVGDRVRMSEGAIIL